MRGIAMVLIALAVTVAVAPLQGCASRRSTTYAAEEHRAYRAMGNGDQLELRERAKGRWQ